MPRRASLPRPIKPKWQSHTSGSYKHTHIQTGAVCGINRPLTDAESWALMNPEGANKLQDRLGWSRTNGVNDPGKRAGGQSGGRNKRGQTRSIKPQMCGSTRCRSNPQKKISADATAEPQRRTSKGSRRARSQRQHLRNLLTAKLHHCRLTPLERSRTRPTPCIPENQGSYRRKEGVWSRTQTRHGRTNALPQPGPRPILQTADSIARCLRFDNTSFTWVLLW
ncbi:hypothetical protein L209DRAFT_438753 [Thermothelomyces heterothallicus CBS 203.75]